MTPITKPPLRPPKETDVLKYQLKYDVQTNQATVTIFYHGKERRIEGGKMSVVKTVKTKKIEGEPKDLMFVVAILHRKPVLVYNEEDETFILKTSGEGS